jgi:hypothetical protein
MKKTLPFQLKAYLMEQGGEIASGTLQRIEWPKYNSWGNKIGTHTPRSVVRRLEEMAEAKEIAVLYRNSHAYYSATKKAVYPKEVFARINDIPTMLTLKDEKEEEAWRAYQAQIQVA